MMKSYDELVKISQNPNWPYISDYLYRILITGISESAKTYALLNLIEHERLDDVKIYLQVKDPCGSRYLKKRR